MSILDNTVVHNTGYRSDYGFNRSLILSRAVEKTGEVKHQGFSLSEQYELSAKLGILFWAMPMQYDDALKQAKKLLLSRLYQESLALVSELRSEIMNGDDKKCLRICDMLTDQMLGNK